jgi:hypothetical protein
MRVMHVNVSDNGGGADRAAYRFHVGFQRLNQDSCVLAADRRTADPHVIVLDRP